MYTQFLVSFHSGVTFIAIDSSLTRWASPLVLLLLLPLNLRSERMEEAMLDIELRANEPLLPRLITEPARSTFWV